MRKVLLALGVAIAVALGATGGGGSASADNQGADWLVAGTGTIVCCNQPMVHVNAQSNLGARTHEATSGSDTRTAAPTSAGTSSA
jgi:Desulfoferrodoxin, N-terminal domain